MLIKVAVVAISGLLAIYVMFMCEEQDFQPNAQLRLALFCTGAIGLFCVTWLAIPESFWYMLWFKFLLAIIGGYSWAYVMPERLRRS